MTMPERDEGGSVWWPWNRWNPVLARLRPVGTLPLGTSLVLRDVLKRLDAASVAAVGLMPHECKHIAEDLRTFIRECDEARRV